MVEREVLAARLELERAKGHRVVLMNGVFDLLHVGHVRALRDARSRGDLLVVALNDDASARRHKGAGRPLQSAAERAEVLAALACVDLVTVFPEETVAETLRILRPQVHAKGRDYEPASIPDEERQAGAEVGAKLELVGDEKRLSSSSLAARLSRPAAGP